MQLAHRVALNGVQLDSIDSRINIKGVEEGAGKESISAVSRASGSGQRITGRKRETMDITVKFSLNIDEADMATRGTVLDAVKRWARAGGVLTLNYKPGKQIRVELAQAPGDGDLWEWTSVYSIVFRAYAVPYWEDATETSVTRANTSSYTLTLTVNGSAETPLEFEYENTSGSACDWVQVSANGHTIRIGGMALASGSKLILDHDANGVQRIRKLTGSTYTSMMGKRTTITGGLPSADEIMLAPGSASVSVSAEKAGGWKVSCKGRYA